MRGTHGILALALGLWAVACGETGREHVALEVLGAGMDDPTFEAEGWQVTLHRAQVAFGPAYFCATESAVMDLCATALLELLEPATVDALDATPQPLGTAHGVSGTIRSGFHDYGIHWPKTQAGPVTSEAAPEGASAVFEGRAEHEGEQVTFEARVRLEPRLEGTAVVVGSHTRHELTADTEALTVQMDPVAWWRRVDFDAVAAAVPPDGGPVILEPDTGPHDRLVSGMTANAPPTFHWSAHP